MASKPKPTGDNGRNGLPAKGEVHKADHGGRTPTGRFGPGNNFGAGNPNNRKVHQLRNALLSAVTEEDLIEVTQKLIGMAKKGSIPAIKELLDRCLGKAPASIELTSAEAVKQIQELSDDELTVLITGTGSKESGE